MNKLNKKVVLLFGYFPKECKTEIVDNSIGVIQYAADALQGAIIEGLGSIDSDNLEIINLPYLGSYPSSYKKLYSPSCNIVYRTLSNKEVVGKNYKFCNFTLYKRFSRYFVARRALLKWCSKYKNEDKVVLIYALSNSFLRACIAAKTKYSNLKIVQIVPDLPEFMNDFQNKVIESLKQINTAETYKLSHQIDGFVLLSDYMCDRLPIGDKPRTVVEGIYSSSNEKETLIDHKPQKKIILYTGTLARRYGVMNLVNAVQQMENDAIELVICGAGNTEAEITQIASIDKRIVYKGQLKRDEVLKLQRQASLLVNPRTPEGEYTKYSFPSKTMEYFASGTPVLLYRLPGIPEEYFSHCFSISEIGVDKLKNKLQEILDLPEEKLYKIGQRARNFILEKKNPIKQCEKIIEVINKL